jgi:hypothetical protein
VGQQRQLQKPKRPLLEWAVAWSVCIWGGSVALGVFTFHLVLGLRVPLLMHGLFCLIGGILSLARLRRGAGMLVALASFMFCILAGLFVAAWATNGQDRSLLPLVLGIVGGLTVFALGFRLLGRWLGMQEDSDAGDSP